jgi:hypothetical protein
MVVFSVYFASSFFGVEVAVGTGISVEAGRGVSVTVTLEGIEVVDSTVGAVMEEVQAERRKIEKITSDGMVLFRMG